MLGGGARRWRGFDTGASSVSPVTGYNASRRAVALMGFSTQASAPARPARNLSAERSRSRTVLGRSAGSISPRIPRMTAMPPIDPTCMSTTTASGRRSLVNSVTVLGSVTSSMLHLPRERAARTSLETQLASATSMTDDIPRDDSDDSSRVRNRPLEGPGPLAAERPLTCPLVRRFGLFLLFIALPLAALAQDEAGGIDVIDVSGPLDASALAFMADSIEEASGSGQELIVLQVNSKAVLDADELDRLSGLVESPPLPLAIWVGPAPAAAFGGIGEVVFTAQEAAIAPGSRVGRLHPRVLGADDSRSDDVLDSDESGLELQPTLRQYLQDLDGRTVDTTSGPVTLSTIEEFEGGVTVKQVTFKKPGLATRFFRLAVSPEAAFFFLVVGLSMVTFEFFALGPGVAAGVAAISLLLGGWGVVTLPTRWWALGLTLVGWMLLTTAYQRGGLLLMTALGTVFLQVGGTFLIDGAGQIDPRWWLVFPSVLAVLFFFLIAMPTVQRARLSTQTVGRDTLVGLFGVALSDFDPEGLVEVNGARWRATAHREAGIVKGTAVLVVGLDGLYLEVEPQRSA